MLRMVPYQTFNPAGKRSNKNKKYDKEYIKNLDYTRIEFPITEKKPFPFSDLNQSNASWRLGITGSARSSIDNFLRYLYPFRLFLDSKKWISFPILSLYINCVTRFQLFSKIFAKTTIFLSVLCLYEIDENRSACSFLFHNTKSVFFFMLVITNKNSLFYTRIRGRKIMKGISIIHRPAFAAVRVLAAMYQGYT